MDIQFPSLKNKTKMSFEEYQKLKRQLLSLRRQYAELVYGSYAKRKYAAIRPAQGEELERQISELELRLAYADVVYPAYEPLTFGEVVEAARDVWARFAEAFTAWYGRLSTRLPVSLKQRQNA